MCCRLTNSLAFSGSNHFLSPLSSGEWKSDTLTRKDCHKLMHRSETEFLTIPENLHRLGVNSYCFFEHCSRIDLSTRAARVIEKNLDFSTSISHLQCTCCQDFCLNKILNCETKNTVDFRSFSNVTLQGSFPVPQFPGIKQKQIFDFELNWIAPEK